MKLRHRFIQIALAYFAVTIQELSLIDGLSINQEPVSSQSLALNSIVEDFPSSKPTIEIEKFSLGAEFIARHDNRRPIWNLAHMVNSIKELDYRLKSGANAIEADVTFDYEGDPLWTYHGPPCDCWRHCYQREDFVDYLNYVREISIDTSEGEGQNLTILFLDLKLDPLNQYGKVRAGQQLAKSIMSHLFVRNKNQTLNQKPFHLILSVNHVNDLDLVNNFIHTLDINNSSHLLNFIGFDVGMNDDLQHIESMWRKFGNRLNLWQGDGFTNCLSPFYNLERLSKAIAKRDNPLGYPSKVYHWTIDLHDRMRESILLGVDAIMTNHPERLKNILQEPEIAHDFRLATRQDYPFKKLTRREAGRSSETARYQRSANTNSGGFFGNLMDILTSWFNYIREIPLLSLPTTLIRSGTKRMINTVDNNSTIQASKPTISPIVLSKDLEYKVENVSSIRVNSSADYQSVNGTISRSSGIGDETTSDKQQQEVEYQPTWYVSLMSNLLVSALRSILPT